MVFGSRSFLFFFGFQSYDQYYLDFYEAAEMNLFLGRMLIK